MPISFEHEALIDLIRQRPESVADLLRGHLGVKVPEFRKAVLLPADLTNVMPAEFRADAVVDLATAKWAATPISTGEPGLQLATVAMGPDQVPVVATEEDVVDCPELAVLSALAHGGEHPGLVLPMLVASLERFNPEDAQVYLQLVTRALPVAARNLLEEMMGTVKVSDIEFAKTVLPRTYARLMAEGQAEGKATGKIEGKAEAILAILRARNVAVPDFLRKGISTCDDLEQLEAWIDRAATATTIDELFV